MTLQEFTLEPDPICEYNDNIAGVAQLVEQRFRKPQVVGSSPTVSSIFLRQGKGFRNDPNPPREGFGRFCRNPAAIAWLVPRPFLVVLPWPRGYKFVR